MGFSNEELLNFSDLFESIGFREIEFVAPLDKLDRFSFVMEPVSNNAVWITKLWYNYPNLRWIWTEPNRILNFTVLEDETCVIEATDKDGDYIKMLTDADDLAKKITIQTELLTIWDELRISAWLPSLCETTEASDESKTYNVLTVGPFDNVSAFMYLSEEVKTKLFKDSGIMMLRSNARLFFSGDSAPMVINTNASHITALYGRGISTLECRDLFDNEKFVAQSNSLNNVDDVIVIQTTLEEGESDVTFRLQVNRGWNVRIETERVICYCSEDDKFYGIFILPIKNVVNICWEKGAKE